MILTREQVAEWRAKCGDENATTDAIGLGNLFDTIDARDAEIAGLMSEMKERSNAYARERAALKAKIERLVAAGDKKVCTCKDCDAAWTAAKEESRAG